MNAAAILVVDDEPQIRRVMRSTLSSHGYVIREATTGEEAVDAVRKERPDLILLDVNMPGIGGIEAAREIREMCDAPIIMLTVRNAERDKVSLSMRAPMITSSNRLESRSCSRESALLCGDTHREMPFPRLLGRI